MNTEQLVLKFHTKLIIRELRLRRQNTHLDTGVWKSESPEITQKKSGWAQSACKQSQYAEGRDRESLELAG